MHFSCLIKFVKIRPSETNKPEHRQQSYVNSKDIKYLPEIFRNLLENIFCHCCWNICVETCEKYFAWWQLLLWNIGDGNIVVYSLSADLCSSCKMPHSLFATIFSRPCIKTKIKRTLTLFLVAGVIVGWQRWLVVRGRVSLANVAHGGHLHGYHVYWGCREWWGWWRIGSLILIRLRLPSWELHYEAAGHLR